MSAGRVNASLFAIGAVGFVLDIRLIASPVVSATIPPRGAVSSIAPTSSPPVQRDSLVQALVGSDLFRLTRRPAAVVYDVSVLAQTVGPPPPRPALALVGIVLDNAREATALIEGLPGLEGPRPVLQGETIGALRVKAIKRDRVVITGLDTTWTLRVREPWR